MKLLDNLIRQKKDQQRADVHRALLHYEARLGGELFGPIPTGHRREFFCLDEYTWIWHEEWVDAGTKKRMMLTTRYDVRPSGIVKSQGGRSYQALSDGEVFNLYKAIKLYGERVMPELSRMLQAA